MTAEDEDVVGELTTDLLARGEWSLRLQTRRCEP